MNRKDIEELYGEDEPDILFADGFDAAISGVIWDGERTRVVYEMESILELLSLYHYKNTLVSSLSYGEIKKLELARLIIEQKKIWVLDEPYIGLDQISTNLINHTIIYHAKLGGMVIFTSHITADIPNLEILQLEKYENN